MSGLRSVATQNKLLEETDLLLKRALELATSMEVAETQAQRLRGALQSSGTDGVVGTVKMKRAKNPKDLERLSMRMLSRHPNNHVRFVIVVDVRVMFNKNVGIRIRNVASVAGKGISRWPVEAARRQR